MTSCSLSKYVAPPFTDLEKILALKPGISEKEASDILKIKPYDIVYSHELGKKILIYNYRVKDRNMRLQTRAAERIIHSEDAQRQGEVWYNKQYRELFVLFENEKLKSIYGEEALSIALNLDLMENQLKKESGESVNKTSSANDLDLRFVTAAYQNRNGKKYQELNEDNAAKNRQKLFLLGGGAAVLFIISLITR